MNNTKPIYLRPPQHTHTQNLLAKNKRTARTVWYKTMEQGDLVYIFPDAMRAGAIEQHVRLRIFLSCLTLGGCCVRLCALLPPLYPLCDRARPPSLLPRDPSRLVK